LASTSEVAQNQHVGWWTRANQPGNGPIQPTW